MSKNRKGRDISAFRVTKNPGADNRSEVSFLVTRRRIELLSTP